MTATYALDDFSVEAEQHRYEHGGRVLNTRKVVRTFDRPRCAVLHVIYGDTHAETSNGVCTCCGAIEIVQRFEKILDMEGEVRGAKASILFAPLGSSDHRHAQLRTSLAHAQRQLWDAVDALTPAEGKAFGQYRTRRGVYTAP